MRNTASFPTHSAVYIWWKNRYQQHEEYVLDLQSHNSREVFVEPADFLLRRDLRDEALREMHAGYSAHLNNDTGSLVQAFVLWVCIILILWNWSHEEFYL